MSPRKSARRIRLNGLARTRICVEGVLGRAWRSEWEIEVVHALSTSEIVAAREQLETLFRQRVEGHDPFICVACGLAVDAMEVLETVDERSHQLVELRHFGGPSEEEVAEVPGLQLPMVKRDSRKARAFLLEKVTQVGAGDSNAKVTMLVIDVL